MIEQSSENSEELSFTEIINALKEEQKTIPTQFLYRLSGLEDDELEEISNSWSGFSSQRRVALLEDLELLAEANTVMHFDAIGRLALNDDEEEIRVIAIRFLWQSQKEDLIPQFLVILEKDESPDVRAQAASALGRFILLGELGKISAERLSESEDSLFAVMAKEDESPLVRRRTLESLGYSSRRRVVGLIEDAYDFGDEDLQASALFAMGRTADDRWAAQVLDSLDDPNPTLGKEAIRAAGDLEIADALPALLNFLHDDDNEVRLAAAWSASKIGGDEAAEALRDLQERSESEDEIDLIEDAIENLSFSADIEDLSLLDFSKEDLEDFANPSANDNFDPEE